jgi:hypothetical protein
MGTQYRLDKVAQLKVLTQGLSVEQNNMLLYCDSLTDLKKYVKLYAKRDSQIRIYAGERKSGRYTARLKK